MLKFLSSFLDTYRYPPNDFSSRKRSFSGTLVLEEPGAPEAKPNPNIFPLRSHNFSFKLEGEINWRGSWETQCSRAGFTVSVKIQCEHFEFSTYDLLKIDLEVREGEELVDHYVLSKLRLDTLTSLPAIQLIGREIKRDGQVVMVPRFLFGSKDEKFPFVR